MKIKKLILLIFLAVIYFVFNSSAVSAAPRYPIKELDYCRNAKECQYFCEIPKNTPKCWSYGKYILNANVLGEETSITKENASIKNVVFPIKELNNCQNVAACREFCQETDNQKTCQEFAVKKNLIKKVVRKERITSLILSAAKTALGCRSKETCFNFCKDAKNREKCLQFGINQKLTEEKEVKPQKVIPIEVLENAKAELGCLDASSCMALCEKEDSKMMCLTFAKKYKLMSGEVSTDKMAPKPSKAVSPEAQLMMEKEKEILTYMGPGGCENEEQCQAYCEDHPDDCPGYPETETDKSESASSFFKMEEESEVEDETEE